MFVFFQTRLTWWDPAKRTVKETIADDDGLGLAAQLAYYFFLALFPALLFWSLWPASFLFSSPTSWSACCRGSRQP
jgi:uncharacterized BrkB/YihY/UPF0761 family membrane protein